MKQAKLHNLVKDGNGDLFADFHGILNERTVVIY
jgi:hypothetical protein